MDIKRFQKRKEDFVCGNCGTTNIGDGFTNHCTNCLYSKHVDIFPGDRKESCGGLMPVTHVEKKGDKYILTHTCQTCKQTVGDHFRPTDNFETLISLVVASNKKNEKA